MNFTRTLTAAAFAFIASFICPSIVFGQAPSPIGDTKALRCSFQRISTGSWKKDGSADAAVTPATLVLRFESIDTDTGTAQLKNGSMSSEVTVRSAEGYLHFMQTFRTGPLYFTTVFGSSASGGKLKAVHSRHEYFTVPLPGSTSSPEQYYGECEVVR